MQQSQERDFWLNNDSADFIDWNNAKPARFSNLKPSTKTISIRLPESLLEEINRQAAKQDVPYQSLLKMFLSESVSRHRYS